MEVQDAHRLVALLIVALLWSSPARGIQQKETAIPVPALQPYYRRNGLWRCRQMSSNATSANTPSGRGFDFRVTIEDEQLMLESAGPQVIGLRR